MSTLFCLGYGFSARGIANELAAKGWRILATSRSEAGAARIAENGAEAMVYDGSAPSPRVAGALAETTHLLLSAPPGEDGDPLLLHHRADIEAAPNLQWIGYLSTIGVYGDHDGGWVDETTAETPGSRRSQRRLDADRAWIALGEARGTRAQVFRLAGIYGPGRSQVDQVLAGRARSVIKPGQVFNRIHIDDIAGTVLAAIDGAGTHSIYNVTDDEPAPPQDVNAYAARLVGRPAPPEVDFETADLSPMARTFYAETKRVRNDRIKQDLGVRLKQPTYREGLAAIARRYGYEVT